jgi:hypothetical protein
VAILLGATTATAQDPIFSIERNLVIGTQAPNRSLTYRADLAPLDAATADTCCALRTGQAVTLVRQDRVFAGGTVGAIIAADVPRAGWDHLVYFTVVGLPDSLAIETSPPTGERRYAGVDIYVAGAASVTVLPLPTSPWADADSLLAMMPRLLAGATLHDGDFPDDAFERPRLDPWLDADRATAWVLAHAELMAGNVEAPGFAGVRLLATEPGARSCLDFVVLDGPGWPRPVDLEGRLDRLLMIDGVVYVVVVDCQSGTGMWGFEIHAVRPDGSTRRVHADGSWQT